MSDEQRKGGVSWATALALLASGAALGGVWFGSDRSATPVAQAQAQAQPAPGAGAQAPATPGRSVVSRIDYVPASWVYNRQNQINDSVDVDKTVDGLLDVIAAAEDDGHELSHVVPMEYPVYRWKSDGMSQWGFGVGATMTRGYWLYYRKPAG